MDADSIASVLHELISLAAPPLCAACGAGCAPEAILCETCAGDLAAAPRVIDTGPPGVDLAVSASPFDGVARRLVHGLKFGRRLSLAGEAAAAMMRALPPREVQEAVVPVPAGRWRQARRGFDPAYEIAVALAVRADLPLIDCLARGRGRRQVGRPRFDRLADPPRVWATAPCPRTVLLVDDVWTTGATLAACAGALRRSGVRRIVALTLAHAL